MKKSFWILPLLILLFACTAFADTGELAIDGGFTAIAAQGNTVYLLDKERNLFIVQAGQAFPEAPACTLSRETDFLLVDQGILYGFEPVSGALFRIDTTTGAVLHDRLVGTVDAFDIRDGYSKCEFSAPMLYNGTLTVHWEGEYHDQGIDQFAPDGTHTSYGVDGDGTLFYGDPDGRIIVVPDWCGSKELGQLEEGEFTWFRQLSLDTWGIALHGEKVYVGVGNYIEQFESLEATSGQIAACLPQTISSMGAQSMKILDDGWAALISHGTFYLRRLDVGSSIRVLTLPPELFYRTQERSAAFLAEYPDVALRSADWWRISPSTGEAYQEAIADLEADVLSCYLDYSLWQALKDEGYVADLSASALLQQTVADMYPAFRDACMHEGRVVGIPFACSLDRTALQINKDALLDKTGFTEEQLPKTYLDLPEFLRCWEAQNNTQANPDDGPLDTSAAHKLCEAFIEQYVTYYETRGEPLVFDTPLFRAGLALRDQIPKLPSVADKGAWSDVIGYSGESLSANKAPSILPLPLDAEHPYTLPITLGLLFVNPNSPNMDLAIAYLESAIRSMSPEEWVLWMPGSRQPVPNPDYESTLAEYAKEVDLLRAKAAAFASDERPWFEHNLSALEEDTADFTQYGHWLVSPDFLQAYGLVSEHMAIYQQDFFDKSYRASEHARTANSLRTQYVNGQIDADALIAGLQSIADMLCAAEE